MTQSKQYQVKQVAQLSGVTVRTLHHYDSIGLLVPSRRTRAGYRLYDRDDLLRLQQILIHRELGFSLEQIRALLDAPEFDHETALRSQRRQLTERAADVARMIEAVDAALAALAEEPVDLRRIFEGFDPARYEEEVEDRWGSSDAFEESRKRTRGYSERDWQAVKEEQAAIMRRMAEVCERGLPPESSEAGVVAEHHRLHIDRWFYPCSRAMHALLADMYVADERFAASFERYRPGLAGYFADAVRANAQRASGSP